MLYKYDYEFNHKNYSRTLRYNANRWTLQA